MLSATKICEPLTVACIQTTEAADPFAASSETVWNRLLRTGCALNVWISAIPLIVCSTSVAIARSAFRTRVITACTWRPANRRVSSASGVSTSAATVICHEIASR